MDVLDALVRTELGSFALEMARITGLVVVSPLLWVDAPKRVRAALVILLTVLVHGQGQASVHLMAAPELAALGVVGELALGAAMGFVVRVVLSAAEVAANAAAPMMGFGMAAIFNPATGDSDTVITALMRSFALWIALLSGLHHIVIGSLLASFHAVPVGSVLAPSAVFPLLLDMSSSALVTGVRLALPLIAVLFMVQIALGFVSRAAPAMQIFSVGFAFTLVTGGIALSLSLPDIGRELAIDFSVVGSRIEAVLAAAAGT